MMSNMLNLYTITYALAFYFGLLQIQNQIIEVKADGSESALDALFTVQDDYDEMNLNIRLLESNSSFTPAKLNDTSNTTKVGKENAGYVLKGSMTMKAKTNESELSDSVKTAVARSICRAIGVHPEDCFLDSAGEKKAEAETGSGSESSGAATGSSTESSGTDAGAGADASTPSTTVYASTNGTTSNASTNGSAKTTNGSTTNASTTTNATTTTAAASSGNSSSESTSSRLRGLRMLIASVSEEKSFTINYGVYVVDKDAADALLLIINDKTVMESNLLLYLADELLKANVDSSVFQVTEIKSETAEIMVKTDGAEADPKAKTSKKDDASDAPQSLKMSQSLFVALGLALYAAFK